MKAYEIINGMIDTLDIFLESNQDEIDKENYEYIMGFLKDELENKNNNIIKYIRNISLDIDLISQEEKRLEKLRKQKEQKIKNLKGYLVSLITKLEKNKIETNLGTLSLRKSTSVTINNLEKIPKEYIQEKIELIPNKKMLSEAIKSGLNICGAILEHKYSLQIR